MYTINEVHLPELDIFDAEVAEKYEHEIMDMSESMRIVDNNKPYSEVVYALCTPVFRCFDNLFGEGTAALVFAGKSNIKSCLKAVGELVRAVENQKESIKSLPDEIASALSFDEKVAPSTTVPSKRVFTVEEVAALLNRGTV